jgi:hypothetical protein
MTHVVTIAAVAPVLAGPSVRAEQVTQLVLGESAALRERQGEWCAITGDVDGYQGWAHAGYLRALDAAAATAWRDGATALSTGARIDSGRGIVIAPLRSRLQIEDGLTLLPDGRAGRVLDGHVRSARDAAAEARSTSPVQWALDHFEGTPYQWGGLTPLGVDCSGLVQTTFLFRGLIVPRDSSAQATFGAPVAPERAEPGDLLFFRSETGSDRITHVAFLAPDNCLVHSTISCGGVLRESFAPGSRAGDALRPRLVAARRYQS